MRMGSPRRITRARFPGIPRVVGLQGRVYHRDGQVQTAEGAPDRGFRWSRLCRNLPQDLWEGSPLNQRVRAVRRMVGRIEGGNDV